MHYQEIQTHVLTLCKQCGRNPDHIKIIAVSKGEPQEKIQSAHAAGCRDFGESRIQEAEKKRAGSPSDIEWHLIGSLQKNKVRKAIGKFRLIHSIDSLELIEKIASCGSEMGVVTSLLLEVNITGEKIKKGFSPYQCAHLFDKMQKLPAIKIEGLMTMAPLVGDEKLIRSCFKELYRLHGDLQHGCLPSHPFKHLSMGMSHDYPLAIEEGATLLRIGTAIFK